MKSSGYVQDGKVARYFIRTGNGTRELDAREAHLHIQQKRRDNEQN